MNIAQIIVIVFNSIAILLCLRGILVSIYRNKDDVIIYLILLFMNWLVMIPNVLRLFGKL